MSGYLEVKYPFKSNLGLNPFKTWKRQWCILRPSPTCAGGGSLAVYCSEAGAPAGTVELPSGCVVRRAKSRTRPYAFAVFSDCEPRKPRILLAAQTLNDAQLWMEKIKNVLDSTLLGTETLLKDSYSVTIVATGLSRKCGLHGDSILTVSSNGLLVSRSQKLSTVLEWKHISDVILINENSEKNKTCVLTVDRYSVEILTPNVIVVILGLVNVQQLEKGQGLVHLNHPGTVESPIFSHHPVKVTGAEINKQLNQIYKCNIIIYMSPLMREKDIAIIILGFSSSPSGCGELKFSGPLASDLTVALKRAIGQHSRSTKKLSKSEGDLRTTQNSDGELRRSSWYSGPSEVSLDDIDLIMSKVFIIRIIYGLKPFFNTSKYHYYLLYPFYAPTAGAQPFSIDGIEPNCIWRMGHDSPRGFSAG
ncbi:unnamed protein product [Diatraea saccharalis]|uniref:PH domain-containing protein n=1 Tax=Diatraea saccharalis TaxID=40085 RepID=A0A9P0C843_9NEOP|nr:unnamed protein product [Diatraea saccharalis]